MLLWIFVYEFLCGDSINFKLSLLQQKYFFLQKGKIVGGWGEKQSW